MVDVVVTTYNRKEMLRQTLESLVRFAGVPFRLFVADDCSTDGTQEYLRDFQADQAAYVVLGKRRQGVVYNLNLLWNLVEYEDRFNAPFPFLCYLQDDAVSAEQGWLRTAISAYEDLKDRCNVGFFSGYDAPEHPAQKSFSWKGREVVLKFSQTATNLIGTKEFWRSVGEIPKKNPDGSERGFPGNGKGSHIDLYLTGCMSGSRFAPGAAGMNCSYTQGKTVLVVPGLIRHLAHGAVDSTWRNERKVGGGRPMVHSRIMANRP